MRILKSALALALVACSLTAVAQDSAAAKESNYARNGFVQLQGGVGTTFTDVNFMQLLSPTASVGGGMYFQPVGFRLHVNAWESKGGFQSIEDRYKFNYVNTNFDLFVNLMDLFSNGKKHVFNVSLLGGLGLNYAWNNADLNTILQNQSPMENTSNVWGEGHTRESLLGHNFRVGVMADFDISKHWSVGLEVDMNSLSDRFNSKYSNCDDWMLTAQIGVTYKFGHRKAKAVPAPVVVPTEKVDEEPAPVVEEKVEEKSEPVVAPEPTPVVEQKPVVKEEPLNETLFYAIRESEVGASAAIDKVVAWSKKNADKKIVVSGYGDKGTGNARVNMEYAQARVDKVVAALKAKGVPASQIEAKAYGDTVQPFAENDKNRCVIIVGK